VVLGYQNNNILNHAENLKKAFKVISCNLNNQFSFFPNFLFYSSIFYSISIFSSSSHHLQFFYSVYKWVVLYGSLFNIDGIFLDLSIIFFLFSKYGGVWSVCHINFIIYSSWYRFHTLFLFFDIGLAFLSRYQRTLKISIDDDAQSENGYLIASTE
jgi:hypothetical protein